MMLSEKEARLHTLFRASEKAVVAFSAGVDSSYLLYAAHEVLGDNVTAVTAVSPFMPREETEEAQEFCKALGIRHITFGFDPLAREDIAANPKDRCYICKRAIFTEIISLAEDMGAKIVLDGSNADDDPALRPGMKALAELGVRSPLREAGLTKADIRELSRQAGLDTWDKPALACLATRIATGEELTLQKLEMTAEAERYIRALGFTQLRVRMRDGAARIEVPPADIPRIAATETARRINDTLKAMGYTSVSLDLAGYGSPDTGQKAGQLHGAQ